MDAIASAAACVNHTGGPDFGYEISGSPNVTRFIATLCFKKVPGGPRLAPMRGTRG